MPSLKEIKGRITSVKSTQKITSAMKMVSSAKLRKAQAQIERFLPYQNKLNEILHSFLAAVNDYNSALSEEREPNRIAIIVISSNSSLCGAFNSNALRLLTERINHYRSISGKVIEVYPIGKKIEDAIKKNNLPVTVKGSFVDLMDKPNFSEAKSIAENVINDFLEKKIDRVELVYNHFKSMGVQIPTHEQYLPLDLTSDKEADTAIQTDYLIEPDRETILTSLIPKSLYGKIYASILDSAAAEQAARTIAMQIATDNASDLLGELTILFNKQRQQAITNELLDLAGGAGD